MKLYAVGLTLLCPYAAALAQTPALAAQSLRFSFDSEVRWVSPLALIVPYELLNVSSDTFYVAQFPGPILVALCDRSGWGGDPSWSRDGILARKYYVRLAPGEALIGERLVDVPSDCEGELRIEGAFYSLDGTDWGLPVPGPSFKATPMPVRRQTTIPGA